MSHEAHENSIQEQVHMYLSHKFAVGGLDFELDILGVLALSLTCLGPRHRVLTYSSLVGGMLFGMY